MHSSTKVRPLLPATRKGFPVTTRSKEKIRASVSFPSDIYASLEEIAKEKKVSIAWVVREAAEQYVAKRWPLLDYAERSE